LNVKYTILEGSSIEELAYKVREFIERGWEPQGGVSAASNQVMVWWFYQAMVLRDPTPDNAPE